jgi:hypothetical protein
LADQETEVLSGCGGRVGGVEEDCLVVDADGEGGAGEGWEDREEGVKGVEEPVELANVHRLIST